MNYHHDMFHGTMLLSHRSIVPDQIHRVEVVVYVFWEYDPIPRFELCEGIP
ncbi:hypothetical protein [Candidatus Accumulibacter phosphatis]|uniref:hypothetical protein n=1 Tax=Candidatus Accumulibacter phosphatis TaxID=327160 RepID=UPI00145C9928|nr:hypothetical protein [Candidatus Accumulibacter phosphatis]